MGEATGVLERIDEALVFNDEVISAATPVPPDLLGEIDVLLEESMENGITILPTAVDEREVMIGAFMRHALPAVARRTGMPLSAVVGQRSIYV